jgi:hypothetical protein
MVAEDIAKRANIAIPMEMGSAHRMSNEASVWFHRIGGLVAGAMVWRRDWAGVNHFRRGVGKRNVEGSGQ